MAGAGLIRGHGLAQGILGGCTSWDGASRRNPRSFFWYSLPAARIAAAPRVRRDALAATLTAEHTGWGPGTSARMRAKSIRMSRT